MSFKNISKTNNIKDCVYVWIEKPKLKIDYKSNMCRNKTTW